MWIAGRPLLAVVAVAAAAAGCTSTRGTRPDRPEVEIWVRDIALGPRRGEVGVPFEATVTWKDNYIREPELEVSGLPPGLGFDPARRQVVGTPRRAGFFTVNVAVRKRLPDDRAHRPAPDERWWPAAIELEIFEPVEPPRRAPAPTSKRR